LQNATNVFLGFNNLTLGSNQRLEFLGDTVLQLITSDFLYKARLRVTIFFLLCF
jgi:dsRNA-specific ribonuclease